MVIGFLYAESSNFKGGDADDGEKLSLLSRIAIISNATGKTNCKKHRNMSVFLK